MLDSFSFTSSKQDLKEKKFWELMMREFLNQFLDSWIRTKQQEKTSRSIREVQSQVGVILNLQLGLRADGRIFCMSFS